MMTVRSTSFLFVVLLFGTSLASHHCQRTIKNKGPHVKLDLGCQKGKITWLNPEEERMISFSDKKRSFTVCLDSARAGTSVYRLEGSAQTLLAPDSEPAGRIGCLESDCTHVTLLLQPSRSDTLEYNYTTSITNVCPKCTSDCQRKCFCNSQYVFVAQVLKSRSQQNHYYQNYVKIRYFLRYHGNYTRLLGRTPPRCEDETSSTVVNTTDEQKKFIPQYGTLKVKSKCSLQTGKTYLFSANLRHKRHNSNNPSLTMCCAQENYKHAWKFYSYLLNNRQCC